MLVGWRRDFSQPDLLTCFFVCDCRLLSIYSTKLLLASASFDHTTRVWDARAGTCLYTLKGHTEPVYSVDFSPNGLYLASGSFDRALLLWSMANGQLVQSHHGGGGIFEVCWNKRGDKIAACYSDNTLNVISIDLP